MGTKAPEALTVSATALKRLGQQVRARRKAFGISAAATAEAAGLSRVTLHRIEKGEPSVSIGAWFNVAAVLGLKTGGLLEAEADAPQGWIPARIPLDRYPQLRALACLAPVDRVATKLLANSDRWSDPGVFSRDVIDLAMMQASATLLGQGVDKAARAYGRETILSDLGRAIELIANKPQWLGRCLTAMAIEAPQALVWQRIRSLRAILDH